MHLQFISESTAIDFSKVEALIKTEQETTLIINGKEYKSYLNFNILLDSIKKAKQQPVPTTSSSELRI